MIIFSEVSVISGATISCWSLTVLIQNSSNRNNLIAVVISKSSNNLNDKRFKLAVQSIISLAGKSETYNVCRQRPKSLTQRHGRPKYPVLFVLKFLT